MSVLVDTAKVMEVAASRTLTRIARGSCTAPRQVARHTRSGPALVRKTAPFASMMGGARQSDQLNFSNPVVVIRAPYRVSFSYAGPDRVWRDTWRGAAQLPRAIRVRVRDAATSVTLAVSTSTLVRAELPARCTVARTIAECPGIGPSASSAGTGGLQGQ